MKLSSSYSTFIIEPNRSLTVPYVYLPESYHVSMIASSKRGLEILQKSAPDLVFLSTNLAPNQLLTILQILKNQSREKLIPLIFVVDWSKPVIQLPGTTWGGKVGLVHSLSSPTELLSTLERVMGTA